VTSSRRGRRPARRPRPATRSTETYSARPVEDRTRRRPSAFRPSRSRPCEGSERKSRSPRPRPPLRKMRPVEPPLTHKTVLRLRVHARVGRPPDPPASARLISAPPRKTSVTIDFGNSRGKPRPASANRPPPSVDVREPRCGSDRAPRVRVVDHRREKIDGLDESPCRRPPVHAASSARKKPMAGGHAAAAGAQQARAGLTSFRPSRHLLEVPGAISTLSRRSRVGGEADLLRHRTLRYTAGRSGCARPARTSGTGDGDRSVTAAAAPQQPRRRSRRHDGARLHADDGEPPLDPGARALRHTTAPATVATYFSNSVPQAAQAYS